MRVNFSHKAKKDAREVHFSASERKVVEGLVKWGHLSALQYILDALTPKVWLVTLRCVRNHKVLVIPDIEVTEHEAQLKIFTDISNILAPN